jgi:peptide/nickel transport system substrate-binding protein
MQMKKRLLGAVSTALILAIIAGCGGGKDLGPKTVGGDTPPADKFVMGFSSETATFYPPKAAGNFERFTFAQTFDALFHRTADGKTVGRIAESYKRVNDTTWEFKIRQGIKFHNGEALTAETVKYSLDLYRDPKDSTVASRYRTIQEIKVVDASTVQIITNVPDPFLLSPLTDNGWILPQKYLTEKGVGNFAANPIGTGPYVFKEWVKSDHITWTANADYWGGKVKIPTLTWRTIPDASARVAALSSGEIDLTWEVPPIQVDLLKKNDKLEIQSRPSPRSVYIGLWPNSPSGNGKALTDPKVRQALNYAVNRQAIIDTLFKGHATLISQPVPSAAYAGYNTDLTPYPYDQAKAKQLLAEAGYASGFTIDLQYTSRYITREQAQAIAADLAKVNVKVNLVEEEYGQFVKRLTQNKDQSPMYALSIQGTHAIEAYEIYSIAIASTGSFNWNKYTNPELDALVKKMGSSFDQAERDALSKQAAKLAYDNPPWIYLWNNASIWGLKKGWKWQARPDDQVSIWDDVSW